MSNYKHVALSIRTFIAFRIYFLTFDFILNIDVPVDFVPLSLPLQPNSHLCRPESLLCHYKASSCVARRRPLPVFASTHPCHICHWAHCLSDLLSAALRALEVQRSTTTSD